MNLFLNTPLEWLLFDSHRVVTSQPFSHPDWSAGVDFETQKPVVHSHPKGDQCLQRKSRVIVVHGAR